MKIGYVFLVLVGTAHGLRSYALNEAVLPLMGDDRLYNVTPVSMAPVSTEQTAKSIGLDMTVTGTSSGKVPVHQSKKTGFFQRLFGNDE